MPISPDTPGVPPTLPGSIPEPLEGELPPTILAILLGALGMLVFDTATAFASRFQPISQTFLSVGTLAIMVLTGYGVGLQRRPLGGALAGLVVGLTDMVVGIRLEVLVGPPSKAASFSHLSQLDYLLGIAVWGLLGLVLGLIGGVAGAAAVRLRSRPSGEEG